MKTEMTESTDQTGPVTVSIARKIVSGREADYEEWLKTLSAEAVEFPGHMGVNVIRPPAGSREYVTIFRFDSYENSKAWEDSAIRKEWLERLDGIVEGEAEVRQGTGLEFWFSLPELPVARPSPHKMAFVLLIVVFVLVSTIRSVLSIYAAEWPMLGQVFVSVSCQVMLMTYVIMPRVTRLLQGWLYGHS
jgi:hypothetical protein